MLALAGVGRVVMDVTATTLLQRATDSRMLARMFGALEGSTWRRWPLARSWRRCSSPWPGSAARSCWRRPPCCWPRPQPGRPCGGSDDAAVARPREVSLLRSIPMFAPLGVPAIERLAAAMVPVHAHTGSAVVRQGDPGDHFYIITGGRVAVSIDGQQVREEGPAESFGEIALLRNVPRTATVDGAGVDPAHLAGPPTVPGGGDRPPGQRGGGRGHRGQHCRAAARTHASGGRRSMRARDLGIVIGRAADRPPERHHRRRRRAGRPPHRDPRRRGPHRRDRDHAARGRSGRRAGVRRRRTR